jgi:Putative restriction endonuclease
MVRPFNRGSVGRRRASARLAGVSPGTEPGTPSVSLENAAECRKVYEVVSPLRADYDRDVKRPAYTRAGVLDVWLVDPAPRRFEVLPPSPSGYCVVGA